MDYLTMPLNDFGRFLPILKGPRSPSSSSRSSPLLLPITLPENTVLATQSRSPSRKITPGKIFLTPLDHSLHPFSPLSPISLNNKKKKNKKKKKKDVKNDLDAQISEYRDNFDSDSEDYIYEDYGPSDSESESE